MESFIWGDASVTYPDWNGTVQLDQHRTVASLEKLLGLDRDEWLIIGFDIGGGERENGWHELHVHAVKSGLITASSDVMPQMAADHGGEIPVTEFLVHHVDPYEILKTITHQFDMRLRSRASRDFPIRVVELGDIPEQGA